MPTPFEEELLELAAAERRRSETQEQESTTELPNLEPGMLLSASARGEVRAAQRQQRDLSYLFESSSHGLPRGLIEEVVGTALSAEIPEEVPVTVNATIELSGPDADWVREELARGHDPQFSMGARVASAGEPNANGDIMTPEALASLFMTPEARSQAELAGVAELIAEGTDIEFDPGMGAVSMVDRPRSNNYGWHNNPSPMGARVVSQRGADGRFHPVGEGIRPMGPQEAATAPLSSRRTYPTPRPPRAANGPSAASERPVDRSSIPTALERLTGKGPFD